MKRNKTLQDVPDGVIECKALRRHKLDHRGDLVLVGTPSNPRLIERHWRCTSCPIEAWDQIQMSLRRRVSPRKYNRPEESKLPSGTSYEDVVAEYYARTYKPVKYID